jgi:hypothetical protein
VVKTGGSDLPWLDQWEVEALLGYLPWLRGEFSLTSLFGPVGEHRPAVGLGWALALFMVNGQWDPILQMAAAAGWCAAFAGGLFLMLWNASGGRGWRAWTVLCAVLALVPFWWENQVRGAHFSFSLLATLSVLSVWLLGVDGSRTRRTTGYLVGLAAVFTLGSGFLAATAVLPAVLLRAVRAGSRWGRSLRADGTLLLYGAAVTMAGLALKPGVSEHAPLAAPSLGAFVVALGRNLAWPVYTTPLWAMVNWLPFALLCAGYARGRIVDSPLARFALGCGWFVILQSAAIAYARGAGAPFLAHRYLDTVSLGLLANAVAFFLMRDRAGAGRSFLARRMVHAWIAVNAVALAFFTARGITVEMPAGKRLLDAQRTLVAEYVATGDRTRLAGTTPTYPATGDLERMIRDLDRYGALPPGLDKEGRMGRLSGPARAAASGWPLFLFLGLAALATGAVGYHRRR